MDAQDSAAEASQCSPLRRISLTFRSIVPGFEDALASRVHDHAGVGQGKGSGPGGGA